MITIPDMQPCTLDDSTRIVQGRIIYAHHVRNPRGETNTLVFITHPGELHGMLSHFEEILSSYVSAATDGLSLLACQHYENYPSLGITHFVNRRTLQNYPYSHRARFYDTDAIVGEASHKAAELLLNHEIQPGWQETDGLLIYMPAQIPFEETLRKQREKEQESFKQFLHRMRRNYHQGYY
ncbi:MAG: hypothetical protein ABIJ21_06965 [Nanoarchaeota archaeon]